MAPAAKQPGKTAAPERSARSDRTQDQSRLLPVLAVERTLRAVLLIGVGLILLTHTHTDWTDLARRFTEQLGLDPSRNETGRLVSRLGGFGPRQAQRDGRSPSPTDYWRRRRATGCSVADHGAST
jgi:glyoxylase-like metal-dependent hydrolase (beta-lactamase superfamily II)